MVGLVVAAAEFSVAVSHNVCPSIRATYTRNTLFPVLFRQTDAHDGLERAAIRLAVVGWSLLQSINSGVVICSIRCVVFRIVRYISGTVERKANRESKPFV